MDRLRPSLFITSALDSHVCKMRLPSRCRRTVENVALALCKTRKPREALFIEPINFVVPSILYAHHPRAHNHCSPYFVIHTVDMDRQEVYRGNQPVDILRGNVPPHDRNRIFTPFFSAASSFFLCGSNQMPVQPLKSSSIVLLRQPSPQPNSTNLRSPSPLEEVADYIIFIGLAGHFFRFPRLTRRPSPLLYSFFSSQYITPTSSTVSVTSFLPRLREYHFSLSCIRLAISLASSSGCHRDQITAILRTLMELSDHIADRP